jgi:hypothetical protein
MCKSLGSAFLLFLSLTSLSCSDGGKKIVEPTGSISISLGSAAVTLTQGGNNIVLVSVTRSGGFGGTVVLSVTGAPAGVTGTFSPPSVPVGTSQSTLTLEAASSANLGSYTLTIRANATGVEEQTVSLALVVEAPPSYTLSAPESTSLEQGQIADVTIEISRTNFAGAVMLSVTGAPAGLTTSLSPSEVPGSSSTLTLDATGDPEAGGYSLTVTGQAQGLTDRTAVIALTVTPRPQVSIQSPGDQTAVVGEPFSLSLDASGPAPVTFSSVGDPLPDGIVLDTNTGILSGTPSVGALLTGSPPGSWSGIVIEASSGALSDETEPFTISVMGLTLPTPYAYMPFDGSDLDDVFRLAGTVFGTVDPNQAGVIGQSVRVHGANSGIRYPTALSSTLNGKNGMTFVSTINTASYGSMFFGLAEATDEYSRVYAGLYGGVVEFGGRSSRWQTESYQGVIGSTAVNDGIFHTVVGVLDLPGDRITIYVDGKVDQSKAVNFTRNTFENISPADGNIVGHLTGYADTSLAPDIRNDEVALWDQALNEYQAATLRWLILTGQSIQSWIGF